MPKLTLNFPETIHFTTTLQVRFSDINGAGHLGNHILISYLNESLNRCLRNYGYVSVLDVDGKALINSQLQTIFKSESSLGDILRVEIHFGDIFEKGFDVYFRFTNTQTEKIVAEALITMLFFDYGKKTLCRIPTGFIERIQK